VNAVTAAADAARPEEEGEYKSGGSSKSARAPAVRDAAGAAAV
jgi:hypothetical protein